MNEYLAAHILKANLKVFRNVPFDNEVQSLIKKIEQLVPEEVFLESKRTAAEDVFESYAAGMFDYTPFGLLNVIFGHVLDIPLAYMVFMYDILV